MGDYTDNERAYMEHIRQNLVALRSLLNAGPIEELTAVDDFFNLLAKVRAIQGNTSNDYSFLACVLAKRYLASRFDIGDFDAAGKAQGAPGLDIDIVMPNGERLIAEIKTTVPYSGARNDLGAQQKASFMKDFAKLNSAQATYKFFFVTDPKSFAVMQHRYASLIPSVEIVLLTNNHDMSA